MSGRLPLFFSFFISLGLHIILLLALWASLPPEPVPTAASRQWLLPLQVSAPASSDQKSDASRQQPGHEKWSDLLSRLQKNSGLRSDFPLKYQNIDKNSGVSSSYIYRHRDYEDIVVKDVFPTLQTIDRKFTETLARSEDNLADYHERNRIISRYRQGQEIFSAEKKVVLQKESLVRKGPLAFPPEARKKYFDQTLRLPKQEQYSRFRERFFQHDPQRGDLPVAARELYYNNLQRLAYFFSSDRSYFTLDYFQENLNKEDFLVNSLREVNRLTGSATASELLFAIENIYEIQQRAFEFYFQFLRDYPTLPAGQKKQLRVETIRRVVERYAPLLKEKKIRKYEDAVELYSQRRLEIMEYLLQSGRGYRRQDALFEQGVIYWQRAALAGHEADRQRALELWNSISPQGEGDFLNEKTWQSLRPWLAQTAGWQQVIDSLLARRHADIVQEKKMREKQLLWPE